MSAYKTVRPLKEKERVRRLLKERKIDVITFTSSSTVRNFTEIFDKAEFPSLIRGVTIGSIGPITAQTAKELGIETDIMPGEYTIPALTEAIADHFSH